MIEHEYYHHFRQAEPLGGNHTLREYCRRENVSPYEVGYGDSRSLREIVNDAGLRVAVQAELLPARAWYFTRDFFRAHIDKDGRLMAKFPWTNKEISTEVGQLTHFLTEETAPIPASVVENMLTIARNSNDLQSQILAGQIEQNQQLFRENIGAFVHKYPNLALLNMGITSLLVISGMHPEYLPALAPLGLGLAQTTVAERSRLGDSMNIALRDMYAAAYVAQRFSDLYSYNNDGQDVHEDVVKAGEQLFQIYNGLFAEMEDAGLAPGALLGSAGTAALGDHGLSAALIIGGLLASRRMVRKSQSGSKEFTEWFVNARNGVITKMEAAIADPAVSQQKLDEIYEDSRTMAEYIHGHNAASSTFEKSFPWMVQSAAAALSFITGISQNMSQYIIAGRVGAAEQKKMLRSVSFNQSLMTIERYHERLRKTFESIQTFQQALCQIEPGVYANNLQEALDHNIECDELTGNITVHRFVDAKGVMHEIGGIPFIIGEVHHIVGESGSGKSALLNYLRIYYSMHDVPFSFAAIESPDKDQSLGFRLAKQLCQGKNKRMARHIQNELEGSGLWNPAEPIEQIWEEWKSYHAPGSKRTESRTNIFIDDIVREYTLLRMNIQSDHILEESGSTGENLRSQLLLLDLDADVIILDEIISNVDPHNLKNMIDYLIGELGDDIHRKTLITVTHKPEVLRLFHQVVPEGTTQNITVIYPDMSYTEPLSNRFVEVNLDSDPNQVEAHIVEQTINRFKALYAKPIDPVELHSELYDFWEKFSLPFELPLEGKLKIIAALSQYRDYMADKPLTELERYYLGGLIDVIMPKLVPNLIWQEREVDAFYRQARYIKYQMFASIPQVYLDFNVGNFDMNYLDDTERKTVPRNPVPPFIDTPTSVGLEPGATETLAAVNTLNAMVRRIEHVLPDEIFKDIMDFVYDIHRYPFIPEFGSQVLSVVREMQDLLMENRLAHNDCIEYAVIMVRIAQWTQEHPEITNQINASRDMVLAHFGELDKINIDTLDVEWYLRTSRQFAS